MSALNLNPETFTEGGGLIDDVDVIVDQARFVRFDYNGRSRDGDVPCLKLDIDVAGDKLENYYSMGKLVDWEPSEDGKQLLAVGSATSIRSSSNGGIFLRTLVEAGFPADKLGDDISVLDGMKAHMVQVPEPERPGLKKTKEQEEKEAKYGPKTILVVSEIQSLPWEKTPPGKKAGAAKKAAPPKKAGETKKADEAPAEEAGDGSVEDKAVEVVMKALAEKGSVPKKDLPMIAFKALGTDPDKNAVTKLLFDDGFLASGPWTFEDGVVSAE